MSRAMNVSRELKLAALEDEWNPVARDLAKTRGTYEGTREFLRLIFKDKRFKDKTALVSSFGIESSVLLKLCADIHPSIPVILVDTGYLCEETLDYRDTLIDALTLTNVRTPGPTEAQLKSFNPYGAPPTCCEIVKKDILDKAIKDCFAWISGRKRFQEGKRIYIEVVESAEDKIKINPLALWTEAQIQGFMNLYDIPAHPLKAWGYDSVGCRPERCTRPGKGRSGRGDGTGWECGIHQPDDYVI